MWIDRDLSDRLKLLSSQRPAVLLTGARQVGKTELLRHSFPAHSFINLDLPSEAESADSDSYRFLEQHPAPVIIDEAQYAPGLFRALKKNIDLN
jgi:predicted AAA+ superfamily ATPase